ncbi:MAG TPA: 50S ribosomal protein L31, partial [Blastocatellia bacterium]|nr:50S ribosomal protein L31 [Blastocatellia bacterium]
MKAEIHPKYYEITVSCACGHSFRTLLTMGEELH